MKREVIDKIAAALRAKTQHEQARYGETKRRREEARADAERLRARAATARGPTPHAPSAGALIAQAKFCDQTLGRAKRRAQAASDLAPALEARREKLERALQREVAAESLLATARLAERKHRLELDEQRRDMTLLAERSRNKRQL